MPRCQSCGATCGASATTRSNPVIDSFTRPARKSSTARSRISRGFSFARWAVNVTSADTPTSRTQSTRRRISATKVEADKCVLVADIDEPVGDRWQRSDDARQYLRASDRLEALWRGRRKKHLATLADH